MVTQWSNLLNHLHNACVCFLGLVIIHSYPSQTFGKKTHRGMQGTFPNSLVFMFDNLHEKKSFLSKKEKFLWRKYLISLKIFGDYERFNKF